jgi:hypothetical protein
LVEISSPARENIRFANMVPAIPPATWATH